MDVIKELAVRLNGGNFSDPYPFGANGVNIDMINGNNLEEEVHLGSPNITSFETAESGDMVITEQYKAESTTGEYYKMKTTFETDENDEMKIIQKLYFVDGDGQESLKKTKIVSFVTEGDNFSIKEVVN